MSGRTGFPRWMRKIHGKSVGWSCERCGRQWKSGWMLEFHHILPTSAGGKDTFDNMECLCVRCHMHAHMDLAARGVGCPWSWKIVRARLSATCGGRNRWWLKKHKGSC